MGEILRKSLLTPDERELYPLGESNEVHVGETVVSWERTEPGWRWSEHVKPIVATPSCRFHHTGVVLRGRIHVRLDDGTETEAGPYEVVDVPPGHDAWVVGDEALEAIYWVGAHRWASPPEGQRVLVTLVITDIVDSTARAERLGDAAWGRLLETHNRALRSVLDRYGGREVVTTGDGLLSMFDGAERAVRGAAAMGQAVRPLGLRIRAGIHTGEVELVPSNVRGVAVHVAARLLALAAPGEVLVSGTTRELVEATDLTFADRGRHELKGLSSARSVFALADASSPA